MSFYLIELYVFFVVLRIEDDVARFVSDRTRCTIEFAPDLSSYQVLSTSHDPS